MRTLFSNLHLVTPPFSGRPLSGSEQGQVFVHAHGALFVDGERIEDAGDEAVLRTRYGSHIDAEEDLGGRCVVPGFVWFATIRYCLHKRYKGVFFLSLLRASLRLDLLLCLSLSSCILEYGFSHSSFQ